MSGTSFEARVTLRPRSLDETFDLALAYLRVHIRDLRGPILVATLAAWLPVVIGFLVLGLSDTEVIALGLVLTGLAERSITVYAGRHLFGNPTSIRGAWAATGRRLAFGLATNLFAICPILALVLSDYDETWIVIVTMLGFVWPFMIASHVHLAEVHHLEQLPLGRAAQRARALIAYRFGRAVGLLTMGALVRALFVLAMSSGAAFLFSFVLQFKGVSGIAGPLFGMLGYTLSGPFVALARFFDYIDARTRREGWDIQIRFNAIAQKERQAAERRLAA